MTRTDDEIVRSDDSPKMAEELAHQIESDIMARRWPEGANLGSESDLLAQYGVSRSVLREAVRVIEHHGAARMRRGRGGGLIVTVPDIRAVQRPATLFLDHADVSTPQLITVRSVLELSALSLAVENLDEAGRRELLAVLAREEERNRDPARFEGLGHRLHVTIARLSGNPVHALYIETLAALTYEHTKHIPYSAEDFADSHRAHTEIVDAMIAGDVILAQNLMRRHLNAALHSYWTRNGMSPVAGSESGSTA
jgi:DNA-binding FadR family transcriptional regulator